MRNIWLVRHINILRADIDAEIAQLKARLDRLDIAREQVAIALASLPNHPAPGYHGRDFHAVRVLPQARRPWGEGFGYMYEMSEGRWRSLVALRSDETVRYPPSDPITAS